MVVLLVGGTIYGFYIHDYLQEMMCVADIGFFGRNKFGWG